MIRILCCLSRVVLGNRGRRGSLAVELWDYEWASGGPRRRRRGRHLDPLEGVLVLWRQLLNHVAEARDWDGLT